MSRHLDTSTKTQWPKSWSSMEDTVVPLERNLYDNPLALWEHEWENVPNWECLFVNREKDYSHLCMWTMSHWLERKQNIDPMRKILMKDVDLGEPISFLDGIHLGCTQRECQISKNNVDNYRSMQKHVRIKDFCQGYGKVPETKATEKLDAETCIFMVLWHERSCKEMRGTILRAGLLHKYQLHALTTTNSKKKKWEMKPKVCLYSETCCLTHIKQAHPKPNQDSNKHDDFDLYYVDSVPLNVKLSQSNAMLYVLRTTKPWLRW